MVGFHYSKSGTLHHKGRRDRLSSPNLSCRQPVAEMACMTTRLGISLLSLGLSIRYDK